MEWAMAAALGKGRDIEQVRAQTREWARSSGRRLNNTLRWRIELLYYHIHHHSMLRHPKILGDSQSDLLRQPPITDSFSVGDRGTSGTFSAHSSRDTGIGKGFTAGLVATGRASAVYKDWRKTETPLAEWVERQTGNPTSTTAVRAWPAKRVSEAFGKTCCQSSRTSRRWPRTSVMVRRHRARRILQTAKGACYNRSES